MGWWSVWAPGVLACLTLLCVVCLPQAQAQLQILSNGNFVADSACNSTKVCFSDCQASTDCTYEAACAKVSNNAECTITVRSAITGDAWIALGFSTDQIMGGDSVTGCKRRNNAYSVFNAVNDDRSRPRNISSEGSTFTSGSTQGEVMRCSFSRVLAAGLNGDRYDLNQNYYWMVARGQLDNTGALSYHSTTGRFFSSQQLDLSVPGTEDTGGGSTDTQSPTGSLPKSSQCGSTLGCFTQCDSGGKCTFTVAWSLDAGGASATYRLSSDVNANSYIAVGFSEDNEMTRGRHTSRSQSTIGGGSTCVTFPIQIAESPGYGDLGGDDVIGCVGLADGTVRKFSAQNSGKTPQIFSDNRLVLVNGSLADGTLTCSLKRPVESYSVAGRTRKNIDEKLILLFARGSGSIQSGKVGVRYHGATNRFFTAEAVAASDTGDSQAKDEDFPLIKLHGALMVGAWVFLASIGIVAARYYKPVWKQDLCSLKVWFQIHRTCMVLAFCCCVAGFVAIFVEVEDWVEIEQKPKYLEGHPIMGVIVTGLCVINPLMALIRPHPGTTYRPLFNWAHWFVGTSAHILGVVTIFFGFELDKADAPDYLKYILAGYVAWQALVELTLEMMACCCKKSAPRSEVYKMSDDGVQREADPGEETDGMDSVRKALFVLHFFVITTISAVLIGLLVVGKKELDK